MLGQIFRNIEKQERSYSRNNCLLLRLSARKFCLVMMRLGDIRYVNTVKTDIKVNLLMSNVNVLNLSRFKMKLTGKNIESFTDLI